MTDNATIIAHYASAQNNYSSNIAAAVLLIYDYVITFDREVELFWTSNSLTAAPVLFYTTRYVGLLSVILARVKAVPGISLEHSHSYPRASRVILCISCGILVKVGATVDYFQAIPVGVFSGLRVFALSKGSWTLSIIVFMLSVVPFGTNMSLFNMGLTGTIDPIDGCGASVRITLQRTIMGFAAILLWNGTIYFIALLLMSVLHVIFTVTSVFFGGVGSALSLLEPPLTSILVWRFMIDLQDANQSHLKMGSDDPLYLTTNNAGSLSFTRAIGSVGAMFTSNVIESEDEHQLASLEHEGDGAADRRRSQT
ncbi:hypothetical protein L226DRAFT_576295 [Lentinus tigrinus ALCF2SS1-7]|uniref:DUF6533 domain-containing protein n=1 Tax=Lentinus tigrinus ALCF2SS1-6 TaxID=1328759 RepID=A0A5C2RR66_9APHY|nr:hypothetical protein L227DRAFT_617056 [Lentinus tigrinus ALCF2SS1-6]RPD68574.1 hypothetical protein L226DRAFT_576295 [Lentinus tigrinus ALCF2SS1-7]